MKRATTRIGAVLLVLAGGACDQPDTRNCPLVAKNGSDKYLLEYELLIPSDCPVPLGGVGEWKRAGANVYDYGERDFLYGEVYVENSDFRFLASQVVRFRAMGEFTRAEPSTAYQAGTGGTGFNLTNKYDFGSFFATNSASGGSTADPYGEIKITYTASAIANVIEGTTIPPRNSSATWRAAVTGGAPPYSYYWYRDGAMVGTSEYYTGSTGTENFGLRVVVVDQTMSERAAVMPVDVGGRPHVCGRARLGIPVHVATLRARSEARTVSAKQKGAGRGSIAPRPSRSTRDTPYAATGSGSRRSRVERNSSTSSGLVR